MADFKLLKSKAVELEIIDIDQIFKLVNVQRPLLEMRLVIFDISTAKNTNRTLDVCSLCKFTTVPKQINGRDRGGVLRRRNTSLRWCERYRAVR
jgi:hypothetical protein